jgi:hypothetical protein
MLNFTSDTTETMTAMCQEVSESFETTNSQFIRPLFLWLAVVSPETDNSQSQDENSHEKDK